MKSKDFRRAVLMMYHEIDADIVVQTIRHWQKIGVWKFYVAETSDKATFVDFTGKFGLFSDGELYYRHETTEIFDGERIINQLKQKAIEDGFNCLFPADADEFLQLPQGCAYVSTWNMRMGTTPRYWWCEIWYMNVWPGGGLSWQNPQRKTVLGSAHEGMHISIGNHIVTCSGEGSKIPERGLYYKHYPFRSKEQMVKKIETHGKAFIKMGLEDNRYAIQYRAMLDGGSAWVDKQWNELLTMGIDIEEPMPKWI